MTKIIAAGLACLLLTASTSYAGTIYSCKKKIGGTIRIVGAKTVCTSTEVKISWPDTAETNRIKTMLTQRTSGVTTISTGPSQWQLNSTSMIDNVSLYHYSDSAVVSASHEGAGYVQMSPAIPSMIYGRSVLLTGARFCVLNADATNYVNEVALLVMNGGLRTLTTKKSDYTVRLTPGCFDITLDTPHTLQADDFPTLMVKTYNAEAGVVMLAGATFYFQMP